MGCFLACFGSSKDRKHRKRRHKVQPRENQRNSSYNPLPLQSTVSSLQEYSEKPVIPLSEVGVKSEEQSSSTGARKKVTFDANVKTYEHVFSEEVADSLPESVEDGKKEKEMGENSVKSTQSQSSSEASSITSSSGSYPPNHRYQNCRESDDELDYEDSDLDDDDDDGEDEDDDGVLDYDDAYEDDNDEFVESRIVGRKLDSKEIDNSMVISGLDEDAVKPIMVNRAARDRSGYVHSVLNPVENLTQWKAVKARGKPPLKPQKENFTVDQEPQRASFSLEASFKELSLSFKSKPEHQSKKANQEAAVDASLSNWLSSSETTPMNKSSSATVSLTTTPEKIMSQGSSNSLRSQDDMPILGALTLEEIKQFSASSSPRKSPSRSPDEMPIIGTVGTYWSPTSSAKDSSSTSSYKGIPNTTSKYREDMKVKWHSTPFETRLERALNNGAAAAYSATHTADAR